MIKVIATPSKEKVALNNLTSYYNVLYEENRRLEADNAKQQERIDELEEALKQIKKIARGAWEYERMWAIFKIAHKALGGIIVS